MRSKPPWLLASGPAHAGCPPDIWCPALARAGRPPARLMWNTDRVEVEVVAATTGQEVDELPLGGQAIHDAGRHGVRLRPGDPVAHRPAVGQQGQSQPFRPEQQTLRRRPLPYVLAVAVADVQPDRPGRLEHPRDPAHHQPQLIHPAINVGLDTDLAPHPIVAQLESTAAR